MKNKQGNALKNNKKESYFLNHKKRIIITCIAVLLIILVVISFDKRLKVEYYELAGEKIQYPFRAVLISDLHSCYYGDEQSQLIAQIKDLNPDILFYTGDIAEDEMPHDGTIDLLKGLNGLYPSYYVTGNHEYWSGEIEYIKQFFRQYGVIVLEGERQTVKINGQYVNICGIEDPDSGRNYMEMLDQTFENIQEEAGDYFTIFLAHRPELVDVHLDYSWDLLLSGHAHGGQFRIPFLLNGVYSPGEGFFPKYVGGLYTFDERNFIISRGMSKESTRLPRIFNPPELVVIDLVPLE